MKSNYLNRVKLSVILLDLIYLVEEMRKDGHIDHFTIKNLDQTIEDLRYNLQFLK